MSNKLSDRFKRINARSLKNLAVAVYIEGIDDVLSNRTLYTSLRYGDPGIAYGDEGLVYGGLRKVKGVRPILSSESSLTISQKIEPESGRGSVSTPSLTFIDEAGFMTKLVSPGVIVDDILGKRIQVLVGFEEISFPEDYLQIFRGYISGIKYQAGKVTLDLSDPNYLRRQELFYSAKSQLTSAITNATTTIPVGSTQDFHQHLLGPDGSYDTQVRTYLKIEDEFIEYTAASSTVTGIEFQGVVRGARGTTAVAHDPDADVTACVEIEGHFIDLALKLMLSGWGGPCETGIALSAIANTGSPEYGVNPKAIVLPSGYDAVFDYGLSEGDFITFSGGVNDGITTRTTRIADLFGEPNRLIFVQDALVPESPATTTISIRSQYDTLPTTCGLKLPMSDVDVDRHQELKRVFLGQDENSYRFFITESESSGKNFMEQQIYLPMGCYSLTRNGRCSMNVTKPPIADSSLQIITHDDVQRAGNVTISRATNNRKFYNQISFDYDYNDGGDAAALSRYLDTESLSVMKSNSALKIEAKGARSDLGAAVSLEKRAQLLLSRYKRGAVTFDLYLNWEKGALIEAGDVAAVRDDGNLQLPNFTTGERTSGTTLYEVIDRQLDIKAGTCKISLVGGVGGEAEDRFGVIAPSSLVASGSSASTIKIQDSFSAVYPGDEARKWRDHIGEKILVRSDDWSVQAETTLRGFSEADSYLMLCDALPFIPLDGYIVDTPAYPDSTDPSEQQVYKLLYAHLTPQVGVVSGTSGLVFTVGVIDASKFFEGARVRVHSEDYAQDAEVRVEAVSGTTITVTEDLGFTPTSSHLVDLIGFKDEGAAYRLI